MEPHTFIIPNFSYLNIIFFLMEFGYSELMLILLNCQSLIRIVLKNLFVPYVNSYLGQGFPLPIIKGFVIRDAYILTSYSSIIVSSDVSFIEPMNRSGINQVVASVNKDPAVTMKQLV